MVERGAVNLYSSQGAVRETEGAGSPAAESLHAGIFHVIAILKHGGNHAAIVQGVPCVEDSVTSLLIRHPDLLKAGPVGEGRDIVLKFSSLGERLAQNPYAFVKVPDLIAVVMVRALAASICKALIHSMVHRIDYLVEIGRAACVEIVEGIPIDDFLDEAYPHLACGIVELIIAQKRGTGDRTICKPLNAIFVYMCLCP